MKHVDVHFSTLKLFTPHTQEVVVVGKYANKIAGSVLKSDTCQIAAAHAYSLVRDTL